MMRARNRPLRSTRHLDSLEPRRLFATVPAGFKDDVFANVENGTAMAFAPDGRLFVASQGGTVTIVQTNGAASPELTIPVNNNGERGLIGLAVSPTFDADHHLFLYYTERPAGQPGDYSGQTHNRISRFTVNGDTIDAASEQLILRLETVTATNHNGGGMAFGPDGKLYVGVGENANSSNAQSTANRLGKVLRLRPDGTIPNDNPTSIAGIGATGGNNRAIFAAGLRNPFTLAFDPQTGALAVNDVGARSFEEIDLAVKGKNYGWADTEGFFDAGDFPNYTNPIYSYSRGEGETTGKTIAGGAFYRSSAADAFPDALDGKYFFGDFGSGWINYIDPNAPPDLDGATPFARDTPGIVDIDVGPDGALYYLQRNVGADNAFIGVKRISAAARANVSLTRTGTLYVNGVVGDDVIGVTLKGSRVRVATNGFAAGDFVGSRIKRIRIGGGLGDDVVKISAGIRGIFADGGAGDDSLFGGDNADTLLGGDGHDQLVGYGGRDVLDGANGRDTLHGGADNDTLFGGSSVDSLNGGPGKDQSERDERENRVSIEILV